VELYEHIRTVAHYALLACSGPPSSACVVHIASRLAKVKLSSVMDGIERCSGERSQEEQSPRVVGVVALAWRRRDR
jgi:hypothetical protein